MESRLKMARKKKGYTQVQLAKLMGVDPNQISHWECGRATPIRSHGMKLAKILETTTEELFGYNAALSEESIPEQETVNRRGFLIFVDGNRRFELPPTPEGYAMYQQLIDRLIPTNQQNDR